ncbi:alpha/beta hydrolase [Paracoccus sp. MBLB3053]|uniref:Alpha/beta hydrolase n=1 Tax=Paracoccus aurantius TaxID=3073814 RepID=A0ABU2HYE2_9RHOB|nr:alpha/beta hydrolase [Paracoccus sp. MBLB3053]MDS9469515.1 alpha/beta hydrolase [Paracoccus sp. MBLB3053]
MSIHSYHHFAKAPATGQPLVLTFHGTGGDEQQFSGLISELLPRAGIVSPRGDVSEHGANRFFRRTGEGIYDMADLARRTEKMSGFIAAHRAANPGAPIWALGYSNGANILASVLFSQPALIDRAVLMHPLIPFRPAPQPGLSGRPVLITAGRRDPISPMALTQNLVDYLGAQGATVELALHDGGHEIRAAEIDAIAGFLA